MPRAGGVGVVVAAAVANTAVQGGAGASLDDTVTAILVAVGALVVIVCAPLVWLMSRQSTFRDTEPSLDRGMRTELR